MDFLTHLWIPILASGAAVWFLSALFWMAIGHHNKDVETLASEKEFIDTLSRLGVKPGVYGFPDFQSCKKMTKEERKEKMKTMWAQGPMGILTVWRPMNMGVNMLLTFLFCIVTSAVIAYLAWAALGHGSVTLGGVSAGPTFAKVFQVVGTAGVLAYCFASFPCDIWFQKSRRAMVMNFIDGVVFGLATGAIFAWLWPHG